MNLCTQKIDHNNKHVRQTNLYMESLSLLYRIAIGAPLRVTGGGVRPACDQPSSCGSLQKTLLPRQKVVAIALAYALTEVKESQFLVMALPML